MTRSLQFCRNQEIHCKSRADTQCAVHFDGAAVRFDDSLGKRKSKPDTLCVLGKSAAVKPFENVRQIFRMDAAAVVLHGDLHD